MEKEDIEKRLIWYEKNYGPYIEKRGLHNWKNLLRKPNLQEWIILTMLVLGLFLSWAYTRDVSQCQELIENIEATACQICNIGAN